MSIETTITCNICMEKKTMFEVKGYSVVVEEAGDGKTEAIILISDNVKREENHICKNCVTEFKKIDW